MTRRRPLSKRTDTRFPSTTVFRTRVEYAVKGVRINTDFIDNSAGVDCSDNEVNIKIALKADVAAARPSLNDRNTVLHAMTEDVAALVLEDNRLQTLALSLAERGGTWALPSYQREIGRAHV